MYLTTNRRPRQPLEVFWFLKILHFSIVRRSTFHFGKFKDALEILKGIRRTWRYLEVLKCLYIGLKELQKAQRPFNGYEGSTTSSYTFRRSYRSFWKFKGPLEFLAVIRGAWRCFSPFFKEPWRSLILPNTFQWRWRFKNIFERSHRSLKIFIRIIYY